ncbi:MFS transporter [Thermoanaerobacter sp. CM-CNRG TB177]|uniref:MFS transporter n=1 Tax=Thermoanaerobacter TaxID=1754 RepID=UPI000362E599|nr:MULTISPECIES: MFS transporter [Thermoanaerobacter]MBT1279139.1 MFS transporter [Thermoanaerobacter sp. CM-CNRG TB177]
MNKNTYTIVIIYLLMMLIGIIENVKGPLILSIKTFYSIDYTMMGLFLSVGSLGFILSTFFGGFLTEKIGRKLVLLSGLLLILLGIIGISMAPNFILFLLFAFIMNMGMGSVEIGINAIAALVFIMNQAIMMNLLHFFYGVGAIISPNITVKLLHFNFTWQLVYLSVAALAFTLILATLAIKIQEGQHIIKEKINYGEILGNKRMWLFAIMLGFYVASELGVGNWAVTFLREWYKMDNTISSLYLSIFFATFTLGRLFGGFIVEKVGCLKSLSVFSLCAAVFIAIGMLSKSLAFSISISGFFYSIIFPTVIATIMKEFKKHVSAIIGITVTIASTINMFANFLIGKLNDLFGVFVGFSAILVFMIVVVFMSLILSQTIKKEVSE